MKKVLGLAVAMAMASQANATIDVPSSDVANTGGSELILVVWDEANKTTYARDLGIDYRAFNQNSAYSFAADTRLSSLFGSTLNPSLVWGVWAADYVESGLDPAGSAGTWGASYMSTSSKEASALSALNSDKVIGGSMVLENFVNATNGLTDGTHLSQDDGSSTAVEGLNANSANVGYQLKTNWSKTFPASSVLGIDQSAYFVLAQSVYNEAWVDMDGDGLFDPNIDIIYFEGDMTRPAAVSQFAGLWKLDNQGTLTWASSNPAPIPVPAAVWLFISGLAGLAGIARRQNA